MTRSRFLLAFVALVALVALASALPAWMPGADARAASKPEIFARGGVAIDGYDPVAYFTEKKPVKGSPEHALKWKGTTWHFASAANRAAFEATPERYAPQYGGYCAYAVSNGYTAKTEPDAWTVHDGKLYLNYDRQVRGLWDKDRETRIRNADANWPKVLSK